MALGEVQGDGVPLRKHLESAWRQTGRMPEQLRSAECPVEVAYLWHWFLHLSRRRSNNGYGENRISDADVVAWAQLHKIYLMPFEIDAIEAMDDVYMRHQQSKVKT